MSIKLLATLLLAGCLGASTAAAAAVGDDMRPPLGDSGVDSPSAQAEGGGAYADPLAPFNEGMFWFNLKLDEYVVRPVAGAYASAVPEPARESVGRFFDNVGVIPRFANDLFQLKLERAGGEVARFGINSTLGVAGLFDVADSWFGLKEHDNDFGLTLGDYGSGSGPYLVLPFFGPSTVRDAVGLVVDGAMNPLNYTVPLYVSVAAEGGTHAGQAVNYRSLHLDLFEEADRYAVDLYGAVQDGYMQRRKHKLAANAAE